MNENNENNNVQMDGTADTAGAIVIEEKPGIGKKVLKGLVILVTAIASGITGFLLGKNSKDDDSADSAETEAPKED